MITANPPRLVFLLLLPLLAGPAARAQLGVLATVGQSASSALTTASAAAAIQGCAFEARNQLFLDIENRLMVVETRLADLSARAKTLDEPGQDKFATFIQEAKTQGAALKITMGSAEKATTKSWPEVRAALAFSYIDYVGAISRAEKLVADDGKD